MKNYFLILALLLCSFHTSARKKDEIYIRQMLAAQVAAWNQGNIESYMKGYWDSDSLLFIGKNGLSYGFRNTLERYKKSYPDAAHMGMLTSVIVSMKQLSPHYYFIVGKWQLKRDMGDIGGSYTLLIRKINKVCVIVADHSS